MARKSNSLAGGSKTSCDPVVQTWVMTADDLFFAFVLGVATVGCGNVIVAAIELFRWRNREPPRRH
jgi:hypothetical protein